MHIDQYKKGDGYEDPDGCFHEDAEDFLQGYVLKFCGCGMGRASLAYVRDVLRHIHNLKEQVWADDTKSNTTYEAWKEAGTRISTTDGAAYFAYYVMDAKGLTEHGGSVPGWLTENGLELLEDLDDLLNQPESES